MVTVDFLQQVQHVAAALDLKCVVQTLTERGVSFSIEIEQSKLFETSATARHLIIDCCLPSAKTLRISVEGPTTPRGG